MLSTISEWSNGKWAVWSTEDWVKAGLVAIWVPGKLCMLFCIWSLTPGSRRTVGDVFPYDAHAPQGAWCR